MIFDIGANIGLWSLNNINTSEKIIAVEASPITFTELVNNVSKYDKIIPVNFAVCNKNDYDDIKFYHANCHVVSTINKDWLTSENSRFHNFPYREIYCKTIKLDTLIQKYGVPDLIKIDVEGGEYECISSLTKKVNTLCFEWATEVNDTTFKCLDHLQNLGFTKYYIQNADNYTFRPQEEQYYDITEVKNLLLKTTLKVDWGMIWCK